MFHTHSDRICDMINRQYFNMASLPSANTAQAAREFLQTSGQNKMRQKLTYRMCLPVTYLWTTWCQNHIKVARKPVNGGRVAYGFTGEEATGHLQQSPQAMSRLHICLTSKEPTKSIAKVTFTRLEPILKPLHSH